MWLRALLLSLSAVALLSACDPRRPPVLAKAKPLTWATSPNGEPLPFKAGADDCRGALAAWFGRADRNGDGVLDLDEMQADAARWFAQVDQDHDGFVAAFELSAVRAQILPTPDPEPELQASLPPKRRLLPALQARVDPVMEADANADFRVSAQEFRTYVAARFAEGAKDGLLAQARVLDACAKPQP